MFILICMHATLIVRKIDVVYLPCGCTDMCTNACAVCIHVRMHPCAHASAMSKGYSEYPHGLIVDRGFAKSGDLKHRHEMEPHGICRRRLPRPKALNLPKDWLVQPYKTDIQTFEKLQHVSALLLYNADSSLSMYKKIWDMWTTINLRSTRVPTLKNQFLILDQLKNNGFIFHISFHIPVFEDFAIQFLIAVSFNIHPSIHPPILSPDFCGADPEAFTS